MSSNAEFLEPNSLWQVFIQPSFLFKRMKRSTFPNFAFPLAVIWVFSWAYTSIVGLTVGFNQASANEMMYRGLTPSNAPIAGVIAAIIMLSWPLKFTVLALVCSPILYVVFVKAFGFNVTIRQLLAVISYAFITRILKYFFCITIILCSKQMKQSYLPSNPIASNAGYLLDGVGLSHWTLQLLSSIDVFTLWALAIIALGISIISDRSFGRTAIILFTCWSIALVVQSLLA